MQSGDDKYRDSGDVDDAELTVKEFLFNAEAQWRREEGKEDVVI